MVLTTKILEYLKESGITRKDFADIADVPLSTVNSILSGKSPNPTYITAIKLAKAANISLDGIAGITNDSMGKEEIERITREHEETKDLLQQSIERHTEYMAHRQEVIELKDKTIESLEHRNRDLNARIKSQVIVINIFRVWILALHIYALIMDSMDVTSGLIRFPLWDILKSNGVSVAEVVFGAVAIYLAIFFITKKFARPAEKKTGTPEA